MISSMTSSFSLLSSSAHGLKECLRPKVELMMDSLRLMAGAGPDPSSFSSLEKSSEALQWHTAYSALAEVVHAFRRLLTPPQLARAVELFSSIPLALGSRYGAQYGSSGVHERLLAVFSSNGADLGAVPLTTHVTIARVLFHLNGQWATRPPSSLLLLLAT